MPRIYIHYICFEIPGKQNFDEQDLIVIDTRKYRKKCLKSIKYFKFSKILSRQFVFQLR